jgi:hypothetical protein
MTHDQLMILHSHLHSTVPTHLSGLENATLREIGELRLSILRAAYKCNVAFVLTQHPFPKLLIPHQSSLRSFLTQDFVRVRETSPLAVQHAGMFIPFVRSHLDIFVKSVVRAHSKSDFPFLVQSSIPALFGHFACAESLQSAAVFYTIVLDHARPKDAIRILAPFFNCLLTFRFVESVMQPFMPAFVVATNNPRTSVDRFLALVSANLPLLPKEHITLICVMRTLRWKQKDIARLFLDGFLIPAARRWIVASPFPEALNAFAEVGRLVGPGFDAILDRIAWTRSAFEVPEMYSGIGHEYEFCAITPLDAITAVNTIRTEIPIPYSLEIRAYGGCEKDSMYLPLLVRVFAPRSAAPERRLNAVLFPPIERPEVSEKRDFESRYRMIDHTRTCATVYDELVMRGLAGAEFAEWALRKAVADLVDKLAQFEAFLAHRAHLGSITGWDGLADRYAAVILNGFHTDAPMTSDLTSHRRNRVLAALDPQIASHGQTLAQVLRRLEFFWSGLLTDRLAAGVHFSLAPSKQSIFSQAVDELCALPFANGARQFEVICRVNRCVAAIDATMETGLDVAAVAQSVGLISSYMLLSAIVVRQIGVFGPIICGFKFNNMCIGFIESF